MPSLILKVGEERPISTAGLFLSIVESSAKFVIKSDLLGGDVIGETNKQLKIPNVPMVHFVNESQDPISITYESLNIEAWLSGKGSVSVSNDVVVQKIVEPIAVTASATVEDGKMAMNVSNAFAPIDPSKITIADGATVEIFPARNELNRKVIVQIVTDSAVMGKARIGASALEVSTTKGIFINGNLDASSGYEWETTTAVVIHNYSGETIELAGGEMWRS
ncbi:hypothetical protein [Thalassotalea profundi]|uniref:Uncharacterized protein n=1 Tax=Thalassotalea profundi TaxID=2036687 RepID=A0ABQ3ILV3_9GAMM|nr:hypothetical protein [Thalassotalea profundi]GHE87482.1 hypothetical protein GCM10011501_16200 [Thalassotalea profundi]